MQAYQTNEVPQTDKINRRIRLIHIQRLTKVFIPNHMDTTKPEQPSKKERHAFPTPTNTKSDPGASICSADRLLTLYNKQHNKNQQRLTSVVKVWFKNAAHQAGWSGVEFLEDIQTGQITGCMLCATRQKGAPHAQTH